MNPATVHIGEWHESPSKGFSGRRADVTIAGVLVGWLVRFRDRGPMSHDLSPWCPMHSYYVSTDYEHTHLGTDVSAREARAACLAHVGRHHA